VRAASSAPGWWHSGRLRQRTTRPRGRCASPCASSTIGKRGLHALDCSRWQKNGCCAEVLARRLHACCQQTCALTDGGWQRDCAAYQHSWGAACGCQSLVTLSLQDNRGGDRSAGACGALWVEMRRRRSRRRAAQQVAQGGGGRADAAAADAGVRAEHRRRRGARPPLVLLSRAPPLLNVLEGALPLAASSERSRCMRSHPALAAHWFCGKCGHRRCSYTTVAQTERSVCAGAGALPQLSQSPPLTQAGTGSCSACSPPGCGARWSLRAARSRGPRQPAAAPRPAPVRVARASAHPAAAPVHAAPRAATRRTPALSERGAVARQPQSRRLAALRQHGRGSGAAARRGGSGRGAAARAQVAFGGGRAGPGMLCAGRPGARAGGLRLGACGLALPRMRERVGLQRAAGRTRSCCSVALSLGPACSIINSACCEVSDTPC
jgi:hypothetical protein